MLFFKILPQNFNSIKFEVIRIFKHFLPTVTAATTGDTITDNVTPPAMAKFRLCFETSLPSYRL